MRLPISKVFIGAFLLISECKDHLIKDLRGPMILGMMLSGYQHFTVESKNESWVGVLITLVIFMVTIMLAVRSYRVFLKSDVGDRSTPIISWNMHESRFLITMILVSLGFGVLTLIAGLFVGTFVSNKDVVSGPLFGILLFIPGAYLASRVLLALPLVSTRETTIPEAINRAWIISKNNVLAILALCIAVPALFAGLFAFLGTIDGLKIFAVTLPWLIMPIEFAIVSLVFSELDKIAETRGLNELS